MSFFSSTWGVAGDAVSATSSSSQGGINVGTFQKFSEKMPIGRSAGIALIF
jgi:hypothetical protein